MTKDEKLAGLLFSHITATPDEYEHKYPPRPLPEGARVSRFAPSPTGFLHIGNLFAALTARLAASTPGSVFFVRVEDTDQKRKVERGIETMLEGLAAFGVTPNEGRTGEATETGAYGPYQQSLRKEIYHCYAKALVERGLAYPCFCTPEELDEQRNAQEAAGVNKGYYGQWAKCRVLSFEEIKANLEAGKPYVLRLKSPGDESRRIKFDDMVKGKIEMPENVQDIVLLKTDGIPTYHFAHAVDDHLMRTTHVVRGDEWIASVPTHLQLFNVLGFKPPKYAHIAPIMKEENGGKRKLSKRKDPEAAVSYYAEQGYPGKSVTEYLLTLANSNFEDWRKANKDTPQSAFPFNLKKMSVSGALFDLVKLEDVSKNVISLMTAEEVLALARAWAEKYHPQLAALFANDAEYAKGIFSIDRGGKKPRKDLAKWSEIPDCFSYFYDELFQPDYTLPEHITNHMAAEILTAYRSAYDDTLDKDGWFAAIKSLCEPLGYTPNVKEFKQNPEAFKGHVGDVSTVIRVAVTGRQNTPDLYAIMSLLGRERVLRRMDAALSHYQREED